MMYLETDQKEMMMDLNQTFAQRTISAHAFGKLISTQEGRDVVKEHGHVSGQSIFVSGKDETVVQATTRALGHWSNLTSTISAVTLFVSESKDPADGFAMFTLDRDELMELQEAAENELAVTPVLMRHLI